MRLLIQRVSQAKVTVEGKTIGEISHGLLIFLGVGDGDTEETCKEMAGKAARLRIFEDENGKMNLSLTDIHGGVLAVSQFTLYGDVRKGKRPSFDEAAPPELARDLYEYFVARIREAGLMCETGRFQAMMQVELVNDGPVTILLDSTRAF